MSLTENGTLGIDPVPELEILRFNPRRKTNIKIPENQEVTLEDMAGDVLELAIEIEPGGAKEIGVKVRCSPDNSEETLIVYNPAKNTLKIDFEKLTLKDNVHYRGYYTNKAPEEEDATEQEAPLQLIEGETLKLRIFMDKSVLEVFANGRQCITQRIYPSKEHSLEIRLFAKGGNGQALIVQAWDMDQAVPW